MNKDYVIVFCTEEYSSDDDVTMLPPPADKKLSNFAVNILGVIANILWLLK